MKSNFGPQRFLFPCPVVLIVTGNMEKANILTIAWISLLSGNPPTLGISVGTKGYSGKEISKNGNFSVNIPGQDLMTKTDFCGITSGKEVDKFEKTKLTKLPSNIISSPIIKECPVNLECEIIEKNIAGTTNHFIARIVETHVDTDKLTEKDKYNSLNIDLVNPFVYIGGVREYRTVGSKIGDAYSAGKLLND